MKKTSLMLCSVFFLLLGQSCYADAIYSILGCVRDIDKIQANIQNAENGILKSQLDVEGLMKTMNNSMIGNSGWGTYQFHDYQSYGNDARSWENVMQLAESGNGTGALGQALNAIVNQFPIDKNGFNAGVTNANNQQYYLLESQTILAARAASQLDYDKVQDQISYQQMLQQQIEKTKDIKSAMDLNNRVQVEANLINLEVLRQAAISNQQRAVSEQANMNNALSNAKFLTKS